MSDVRLTYSTVEDSENFVSQQMQVAHVRVRGEDDPKKQEQIVSSRKQQITRFLRFADQQHRLSGRQYSHFRMTQNDMEMQYVNNTGQPLVYVGPPEQPIPKNVVIEESPTRYKATALIQYGGTGGELSSLANGATVTLPGSRPSPKAALISLPDTPESVKPDPANRPEELTLADFMQFRGFIIGYHSVEVEEGDDTFDGFHLPDEAIRHGIIEFPAPVPLISFAMKLQLKGTDPEETEEVTPSPFGTITRRGVIYTEFDVLMIHVYLLHPDGTNDYVSVGRVVFSAADGFFTTELPNPLDPQLLPATELSFLHNYEASFEVRGRSAPGALTGSASSGAWGEIIELKVESPDRVKSGGPGVGGAQPENTAGVAWIEFSAMPSVEDSGEYTLDGWTLSIDVPHTNDGVDREFDFEKWGTSPEDLL